MASSFLYPIAPVSKEERLVSWKNSKRQEAEMILTVGNWGFFQWALLLGVGTLIVSGWFMVINAIYHNK